MTWEQRKQRLIEIRKEITAMGHLALQENLPMEVDKVGKFLAPYAAIEKAIDKLINRGAK